MNKRSRSGMAVASMLVLVGGLAFWIAGFSLLAFCKQFPGPDFGGKFDRLFQRREFLGPYVGALAFVWFLLATHIVEKPNRHRK